MHTLLLITLDNASMVIKANTLLSINSSNSSPSIMWTTFLFNVAIPANSRRYLRSSVDWPVWSIYWYSVLIDNVSSC